MLLDTRYKIRAWNEQFRMSNQKAADDGGDRKWLK
jgi:hypothetical protein